MSGASLSGRVALVTGASRGIGRAIAERLARDGAAVVVHYRESRGQAEEIVKGIADAGGSAVALSADLSRADGVDALFNSLSSWSKGNRLDILVNNAAVTSDIGFDVIDDAEYDRVMQTNLKSPFFVTQRAATRMDGWGRVINLAALSAHRAYSAYPAYSMAKAGLVSMTALLAQHLGRRGITVNAVSPGATDTDMSAVMLADQRMTDRYRAATPLGRIGEPRDIASVVAFLASEEAGWVTGQTIVASGGFGL